LVFFAGRLLTEIKQIVDFARKPYEPSGAWINTRLAFYKEKLSNLKSDYIRDCWNVYDLLILVIFVFVILPLRIVTWVESESVNNNRILVIAGYLYGFNTMLLTLRAFGSILETFKEIGPIQIALFHIIKDAVVVVVHFVAITLAFASAITKVFVAEKTLVSENTSGKQPVCNKSGIQCWWKIATHLGWSLLDLSEGLSPLESTDSFSETLAHLLFAAYLVLALILLINMLIALLSNTYQRVQDNARNEWVFKKAIAVETYRNYHPIPVPFNIISIPAVWIYSLCKRKAEHKNTSKNTTRMEVSKLLVDTYRRKYGDSFPPTNKIDQILDGAEKTESMVNQILYRTFTYQKGYDKALLPTGPEAWHAHEDILVDDYLIKCHKAIDYGADGGYRGARYKVAFSRRFPHFEVMILESGETKWVGLGVVFEDYDTDCLPGEDGTVGCDPYRCIISRCSSPQKASGSVAVRRGDVIRCSVMFEEEQEIDGKIQVPVVFSVNRSRIVPEDNTPTYIEYSEDRQLFPCVVFEIKSTTENSVLAKMCTREDVDYHGQEIKSRLADIESKLECFDKKLDAVVAMLAK